MNAVEQAAIALVGAKFRLHGRDPATGLDCVGVVARATGIEAPSGYALRGGDAGRVSALIERAGLIPVSEAVPGDVMLMRTGPAQLHLAIRTARGLVHADAALRRVVERPGRPDWEILGLWRQSS
ncbi:peptidoglycan endopeptidase [Sphingomonas sp. MAH-20]|uniref:Peptidoglycan endopeptidase n=1 Tax=Sphingomonas horti TaxID=2682842 RepID=A0A6I4J064_9SPHN|nr:MULTISPECIES: peptidoglycan endopeptidase [Sphingomonas]MBA2920050.1 peptidoglycan endopeptidase [Sphingomonas sp. CGMCC 1.13658]MVO77930.1 peptidoglycan endopeptidase [Sphingomonas horti]